MLKAETARLHYVKMRDHIEPGLCFAGNFLSIKQNWKSGDQVTMELPLSIRTEAIKGVVTIPPT